jgi:hypothetical protein
MLPRKRGAIHAGNETVHMVRDNRRDKPEPVHRFIGISDYRPVRLMLRLRPITRGMAMSGLQSTPTDGAEPVFGVRIPAWTGSAPFEGKPCTGMSHRHPEK